MGTWIQKTPDEPHARTQQRIADVPLLFPRPPSVALCIAVLNEGLDLEATVATAVAAKTPPQEIIVVDDGSKQPVKGRLTPWASLSHTKLTVITHAQRAGSGPSKHEAMQCATADVVCVADSHMRFPWDWTDRVTRAVTDYPYSVFSAVSLGFEPDSGFYGTGCFFDFRPAVGFWVAQWQGVPEFPNPRIPCVHGGFYAATRQLLRYVGGYTPAYKGWGVEEEYLSLRAYLLGFGCRLISDLKIPHQYQRKIDRQDRMLRPDSKLDALHNRHVAARVCFGEDVYHEIYRPALMHANPAVDPEKLLAPTADAWRMAQADVQAKRRRTDVELLEACGVEHPAAAVSF